MNIWHDIDEKRITPQDFMACIEITKGSHVNIAIPYADPTYMRYKDISELPAHIFQELQHFFRHYKSLEGKKTVVNSFGSAKEAVRIIEHCISHYRETFVKEG